MKLRMKIGRWCVCLLAMVDCADLHAMMEADKCIGAWRLVSAEFRTEDGAIAEPPYGPEPQGLLMYDAQGSMSAQLAQKGRTAFAIADRMAGTTDEIKAAFESYHAYYGRYKIDEREHVVTHTVIQSLLPNWVGTEQRRQQIQGWQAHPARTAHPHRRQAPDRRAGVGKNQTGQRVMRKL